MPTSRKSILHEWLTQAKPHIKYMYVAICLRGCPYSESASRLNVNVPRRIVWISRDSTAFQDTKKMYRKKTFPICLAIPVISTKETPDVLTRRVRGTIVMGGFNDIAPHL